MTRRRRLRHDVEEALIRLDVQSLAETAEIAQDVARKILESCVEHGDPLPPAFRKRRAQAQSLTIPVGLPAQR
jgi:hypothetical protein